MASSHYFWLLSISSPLGFYKSVSFHLPHEDSSPFGCGATRVLIKICSPFNLVNFLTSLSFLPLWIPL